MRINKESDFKLIETHEALAASVPFKFSYFTSSGYYYEARYDGMTYTNCKLLEDGSLMIIFDRPRFEPGQLSVRREFFLTDIDFLDGVNNKVSVDPLDILIVDGASDEGTATVQLPPAYQQGPPGETPYIGANGNWWVGEEDTGVAASGGGGGGSITIDDKPTENSKNAVSSGGVYDALKEIKDELPATVDIAQFVGNDTSGTVTAEYYASLESIAARGSSILIGGYASEDGIVMTIPITVMSDGGGGVAISFFTGMNTNSSYMVTILNNLAWTLTTSDLATKNELPTKTSELTNDSGLATEEYVDDAIDQSVGNIGAYLATI